MDIFSQKKLLVRLVIILVMLNMALLVFFGWNTSHPPPPPPKEPNKEKLSDMLKKELSLSEKQTGDLRKIRNDFFEKEKVLNDIIRSKRDSMNAMMFSAGANDDLLKKLASGVSESELKMELLRVEQSHQIRVICNPEQLRKLESLVLEIRDYLKPDRPTP